MPSPADWVIFAGLPAHVVIIDLAPLFEHYGMQLWMPEVAMNDAIGRGSTL